MTNIDSVIVIWPDEKKQQLGKILLPIQCWFLLNLDGFRYGTSNQKMISLIFSLTLLQPQVFIYQPSPNMSLMILRSAIVAAKIFATWSIYYHGDINGDGSTDFFVGGGFNFSGKIIYAERQIIFRSRILSTISESLERTWIVFCLMQIMIKILIYWLPMGIFTYDDNSSYLCAPTLSSMMEKEISRLQTECNSCRYRYNRRILLLPVIMIVMGIWICLSVEECQESIRCLPEVSSCKTTTEFFLMLLLKFVLLFKRPA